MNTLTLDTNCIIDLDPDETNRPNRRFVRMLVDAHARGQANVAIIAIMASEKQKGGSYLESFNDFQSRLKRLGLSQLPHCLPPLYFGITFWNNCVFTNEDGISLEKSIHHILFPLIEYDFAEYCMTRGLDKTLENGWTKEHHIWRNAKCDVLALWSHIEQERDIFVTSDNNFHNYKNELLLIGANSIQTPEQTANQLIQS